MAASPSASDSVASLPRIPNFTLLRPIGKGSYGEVWLARSVTGVYRAIKIIYRKSFDHDRPFDREFAGIQNFEPLSHSHESHLSILHVGQCHEGRFFFYVMELADDAASALSVLPSPERPGTHSFDPLHYVPKTLEHEIRRRGRLPVDECVFIGLQLAKAIHLLHLNGLTHRDIKPANVIFIQNRAKLSDLGLVASSDDTQSFVGTKGFVPPEGPGTPQADIYSLGKLLYEACNGRPCHEFPELPSDVRDLPDRRRLIELNEIIIKACAPHPQNRYPSALEMQADLQFLHSGRSVRRRNALRSRAQFSLQLAAAAAVVFLLAYTLHILWRSSELKKNQAARSLTPPNDSSPPDSASSHHLSLFTTVQLTGTWDWRSALSLHPPNVQMPFLLLTQDKRLLCLTDASQVVWSWTPPSDDVSLLTLQLLSDVDGDGRDEAFLSWRTRGSICLSVVNQNRYQTKLFSTMGATKNTPFRLEGSSSFDFVKIATNTLGERVVLCAVGTGFMLKPRALYCFRYSDEQLLWKYDVAPYITSIETVNLLADQAPAIVVGSDAVSNGHRLSDGTDDFSSFLYGFTTEGKLLWTRLGGQSFTKIIPIKINHGPHSKGHAFCWVRWGLETRHLTNSVEHGLILKLNPNGAVTDQFRTDTQLMSAIAGDFDNDGIDEILATDRNGFLLVLDQNLKLLKSREISPRTHTKVSLSVFPPVDLDQDGANECVLTGSQIEYISGENAGDPNGSINLSVMHQNRVFVLNSKLETLAQHLLAERWVNGPGAIVQFADFNHDQRPELLVLCDKAHILEFSKNIRPQLSSLSPFATPH